MTRAQAKLLEQGETVDESVWQHLSPLAWKHINLVGSYHFSDVHLEGEFRPLRELESRRGRRERGATLGSSPLIDQEMGEKGLYREQENPEEKPVVQLSLLEDDEQIGERL